MLLFKSTLTDPFTVHTLFYRELLQIIVKTTFKILIIHCIYGPWKRQIEKKSKIKMKYQNENTNTLNWYIKSIVSVKISLFRETAEYRIYYSINDYPSINQLPSTVWPHYDNVQGINRPSTKSKPNPSQMKPERSVGSAAEIDPLISGQN